jgi:cytosine/adenosine deaminase-related metal-dependent hydrolase
VLYLTFAYGSLPWIALALACSFGTYGLVKKLAPLGAVHGLALETCILFFPALMYLLYQDTQGHGAFLHSGTATELLMMGTTAILSMETVHDTDAVFEAVAESGIRATVGKCMMDATGSAPSRLQEGTRASIDESLALHRAWHGRANGRVRAAFAPRFAVSCSRELLEAVASLSADRQILALEDHLRHVRPAETRSREISRGLDNLQYLASLQLTSPRLCVAHCVWADEAEQALLARDAVKVMHCPGSNLKLGSGIAPVAEMRAKGITVSLGADGAACNNRLDMFEEMRLAAVLQAMRHQPGILPAREVVEMATRDGARTLGLEDQLGSIEVGKRADLIIVNGTRAPGAGTGSVLHARLRDARHGCHDHDR